MKKDKKVTIGVISGMELLKSSRPRSEKFTGAGVHLTKKDKAKKRSGREHEKQKKAIKNWKLDY